MIPFHHGMEQNRMVERTCFYDPDDILLIYPCINIGLPDNLLFSKFT